MLLSTSSTPLSGFLPIHASISSPTAASLLRSWRMFGQTSVMKSLMWKFPKRFLLWEWNWSCMLVISTLLLKSFLGKRWAIRVENAGMDTTNFQQTWKILICTAAKHKVQLYPNKNHAGHLPLHSRNIHKAKLLKHRRPVSHDGSVGWLCPKKAVPTGIWTARRRRWVRRRRRRRQRRRRRRRRRRTALIKSNNPHLASGEKTSTSFETNTMSFTNTFEDVSENGVPYSTICFWFNRELYHNSPGMCLHLSLNPGAKGSFGFSTRGFA